jgi:hypothetical protein
VTDIFEEVEEQLRSDRYLQFARKIWPWVLGAAVLALLATLAVWGYQTYHAQQSAKASQAYATGLDDVQKGDTAKAFADFGEASKLSSGGYKALALMEQGGIRLLDGKLDEAVKLFDQAATAAPDPIIGDIARLKSAFALMDTAPYDAIQQRLQPLTDAKRPYYVAAREGLAMAKLRAGRLKEARSDFVVLTLLPGASQATRQRAQLALMAIDGGSAASLPAVVQAAVMLPPPPPQPMLAPQAPQSGADQ